MIFANLSTSSDNKLLETGGMIYVTATCNNENCILKEGKEITIWFPYSKRKKGMELFAGQWKNGNINWEPTKDQEMESIAEEIELPAITPSALIVEQMPDFPGGRQALLSYIKANLEYPYSAYKKGIQGKVFVQFVVDTTGNLRNICIIRGVDTLLNQAAYFIVKNMPKVDSW